MKKLLLLLSLGLFFLSSVCCSGSETVPFVDNGSEKDPFVDDFDQMAWEVDVTENAFYADFAEGTWWFRKETSLDYIITGEFVVTMDITGSDYNRDDYFENFNYTKIIQFNNAGYYCEYDNEDIEKENGRSYKISTFNRLSVDYLDTSKKAWSERTVVTCNQAKTKFKTYKEEWALENPKTGEWGIAKTTCFFEKIN